MKITKTSDLWWKNAVVYCLDVETYMDSSGDGTGDLAGLVQRIDHLAELGVTCLWLMPVYPSPDRDDGYDITDFYGVDPRLGNHGDFVEVVRTARDRGMRVIVDLVCNHTSDQHPWFRNAKRGKNARYRDWYVWRDEVPKNGPEGVTFPDKVDSLWEYDENTEQYYLHRFYIHQPDLNVANPQVRDEIKKIMGFWLELGVSGFRVDAVPFLLETQGIEGGDEALPDPHEFLEDLRGFMNRRNGDAILLGEVNLPHKGQKKFFGGDEGNELTMLFDFIGMQNLYLSMARQDAGPLAAALTARPDIPTECQWATFVRNHDELTLDKLTESQKQEVFDAFGPDADMQLFDRGLRRRVPPMLGGDPRRIKMTYSLLFSLPGTPVLFYGEEIGMGENLEAEGRLAVRTPMQWTDSKNGGFSDAAASQLPGPVVTGPFSPEHVNVSQQRHDPDSLLHHIQLLARRYRECPELGWGTFEVLDHSEDAVLAHRCSWDGNSMVALHNLSPDAVTVPLTLKDCDQTQELVDLLEEGRCPLDSSGAVELALNGYGFRWLRIEGPHETRLV